MAKIMTNFFNIFWQIWDFRFHKKTQKKWKKVKKTRKNTKFGRFLGHFLAPFSGSEYLNAFSLHRLPIPKKHEKKPVFYPFLTPFFRVLKSTQKHEMASRYVYLQKHQISRLFGQNLKKPEKNGPPKMA